MKNIKILHLFPNLLSLYGEYGNIAVLRRTLSTMGCGVTVDTWEEGELDLTAYDFIYAGAGTEDNLLEAIIRLMPHRDTVKESIENGTHWLATGNAMTLFGTSVTRGADTTQALGCFGYSTIIQDDRRYLGDVLAADIFGAGVIGYVNTSCVYSGEIPAFLTLRLNPKLGNSKDSAADGIRYQNFFGTQLIGPLMAKNPHILVHFCQSLTGEEPTISADSNIRKAYQISLNELQKRLDP